MDLKLSAVAEEKSLSEANTVLSKLAGVKDGLDILRKVQTRRGI